LGELEYNCEDI